MEPSEMFLWVWAVCATVLAVWFKHVAKVRGMAMLALTLGFKHIAEGKAEITMVDGEMRIKKVGGKDDTTK